MNEKKHKPDNVLSAVVPRRRIAVLQAITAITAVIALVISVVDISGRVNNIQSQRRQAAIDSCFILQKLILSSGAVKHQTHLAQKFLEDNGLANCYRYARSVTQAP